MGQVRETSETIFYFNKIKKIKVFKVSGPFKYYFL